MPTTELKATEEWRPSPVCQHCKGAGAVRMVRGHDARSVCVRCGCAFAEGERMPWPGEEVAWLVEMPGGAGLAMGVCGASLRWTTFDQALRFARKQDAEAFGRTIARILKGDYVVTEHSWG